MRRRTMGYIGIGVHCVWVPDPMKKEVQVVVPDPAPLPPPAPVPPMVPQQCDLPVPLIGGLLQSIPVLGPFICTVGGLLAGV